MIKDLSRFQFCPVRRKLGHFISTRLLLSVFAAISVSTTISGQSGRTTPDSAVPAAESSSANPTDINTVRGKNEVASSSRYRLVFPVSFEGTPDPVKGGNHDPERQRRSRTENFVSQMNAAALQGYRLVSVINGWNPIGLMVQDETEYEYAWFETKSSRQFEKFDFEGIYSGLANRGFHLAAQLRVKNLCEPTVDLDGLTTGEECEAIDLFLVERKKGSTKPVKYVFINLPSLRKPGSSASDELSARVSEKLEAGYYPVCLISQFEILMEEYRNPDDVPEPRPHVRIIRSPDGRGQLVKRANDLAKNGYELVLANNGVAIMLSSNTGRRPLSYVWLDTAKRNMMLRLKVQKFEPELQRLATDGAVLRRTYPNKLGDESTLIFEKVAAAGKDPKVYKILRFDLDLSNDLTPGLLKQNLSAASLAALKELNELAKNGYEVRGLFYSDAASLFLQKSK